MLINAIVLGLIGIFLVYCLWDACRKFIGRNPNAPGVVARFKKWWPGFVNRNIVDDGPESHEDHAKTRYNPPTAQTASKVSKEGKPRPGEIKAAQLIAQNGHYDDRVWCPMGPVPKGRFPCPKRKNCDWLGVHDGHRKDARAWLSSHGIDPDAEIEAIR